MDMPKDKKTLSPAQAESRAEALMLMDNLIRHLNDEDDQTGWLMNAIPDGAPELRMTPEQMEYYSQFVDDFEAMTKIFATIVRRVCFGSIYKPRGFC
jgi:hypothetical protein